MGINFPGARFLAVVVCFVAAGLAGCGDAPHVSDAYGSILHRGNAFEPETLDPHRVRSVETFNIIRDLYEGLIAEQSGGELGPGVAESWKVSDDGLTWTFRLRSDARWSNGEPVTAVDFQWSLRRAVHPDTGSYYAQMLSVIEDITVPEPGVLALHLTGPTPYLLGLLAQPIAFPVHRESVERHGERFTRPGNSVSNGAYRMVDWVSQSHLRVERNLYYWNDANTRIHTVMFYPVEAESTELARYRAGDLHLTRTIPVQQYEWLQRNLPDELHVTPYLSTYFYGFNLTKPPFQDNLPLREALSLAIDREVIAGQVVGSGEVAAYSWVTPGIHNYTPQRVDWADWPRARQLEEASRLYEAAGYSAANPLQVELRYNTAESHRRIAVAIASMWREHLGVQTTLHNEEWQVFLSSRQSQQLEVYRSGWVGDYNDANTFAEAMMSTHGLNDMGWHNDEYDRLVRAAGTERDPVVRRELLEHAERLMLADHPIIPIYFYVSKALVKPTVGGYVPNVMNVHPSRHLYLKE